MVSSSDLPSMKICSMSDNEMGWFWSYATAVLGLFQQAAQRKAKASEVSLYSCGKVTEFPFCWCSQHMCATEGDIKGAVLP